MLNWRMRPVPLLLDVPDRPETDVAASLSSSLLPPSVDDMRRMISVPGLPAPGLPAAGPVPEGKPVLDLVGQPPWAAAWLPDAGFLSPSAGKV